MIKRFLIAIVLLELLAGGLIGFNLFRDKAIEDYFANIHDQVVPVSDVTVVPKSWTRVIEAICTASASRGVHLRV